MSEIGLESGMVRDFSWSDEQRLYLKVDCRKAVAADVGVEYDTLSRWIRGRLPIPAYRLPQFCQASQNYAYLRHLAERAKGIFMPERKLIIPPTQQLITTIAAHHGRFIYLAERVMRGLALSDDQQHKLEEDWVKIQQVGNAIIEQSRKNREKDHENSPTQDEADVDAGSN